MTELGPVQIRDAEHEERWRRVLTGQDQGMREFRGLLKRLPSSPRCKQCNSPFGGFGGPIMRAVGKTPWVKNASAARAGEMLVSADALAAAGFTPGTIPAQELQLRGRTEPLTAYGLGVGAVAALARPS
jgi:hypothetical protein